MNFVIITDRVQFCLNVDGISLFHILKKTVVEKHRENLRSISRRQIKIMGNSIDFISFLKDSIKRKNTVGVFRNINRDDIEDVSDYRQEYLYNIASETQTDITGAPCNPGDGLWFICRTIYDNEFGDSLSRYTKFKSGGMRRTGLKTWTEWHGKMCD